MIKQEVNIEKLRNDADYYGEYGKQFISNSDIGDLINNPAAFKQNGETTLPMLLGSYFEMLVLEPNLESEWVIIDASTRNTKVYKEYRDDLDVEILLLQKEADEMRVLADKMRGNMEIHELIYDSQCTYQDPAVKEIHGNMWKGKCDISHPEFTLDLKSTADINKFSRSAWMYNYDSQAWVYQELFGKPMKFIVGCKKTGQVGIYTCSDEFLQRGEDKVMEATIMYDRFYADGATEDINNYLIKEVL